MSLVPFSRSAIERVAENKIIEAAERGQFDCLPGAGKPIAGLADPFDPNWWVRRWVDRERLERLRDERAEAERQCRDASGS